MYILDNRSQQKNITDLASYAAMKQRIQWQNFAQSLIMMQSGEITGLLFGLYGAERNRDHGK